MSETLKSNHDIPFYVLIASPLAHWVYTSIFVREITQFTAMYQLLYVVLLQFIYIHQVPSCKHVSIYLIVNELTINHSIK